MAGVAVVPQGEGPRCILCKISLLNRGHSNSPEAWASTVVSDTVWMSWSMAVVCNVAISCWPNTLRTMSRPADSGA